MRNIKNLLIYIMIVLLFTNSQITVFAQSEDYKKHEKIYDESYIPFLEEVKKDTSLKKHGIIVDEKEPDYNLIYIYKEYHLVGEIAKNYKNGMSIDTMLDRQHDYWIFSTPNGSVKKAIGRTGGDSIMFAPKDPEKNYKVDFSVVEEALKTLNSSFEDENLTVICIRFLPFYCLQEIVYINLSGKEYFISFCNNSKLSGFENGKLYDIDKLIKHIEKIENKVYAEEDTNKNFNYYVPYMIIGGCVVVICAAVVFVIVKKRKINN